MFRVQFKEEHRDLVLKIAGESVVEVVDDEPEIIVEDDSLIPQFEYPTCEFGSGNGIAVVGMKGFDPDEPRLTITFESVEAAQLFKSWLCCCAEQDFYAYEEIHGEGRTRFDYHLPGGCDIIAQDLAGDLE